jgi:hypothetical protein
MTPARRTQYPWMRGVEDNLPRTRRSEQGPTWYETVAVAAMIMAIVGMAIWFIFFSSGGIGPGTV